MVCSSNRTGKTPDFLSSNFVCVSGEFTRVSGSGYSAELCTLIDAMLQPDPFLRADVNTLLAMPPVNNTILCETTAEEVSSPSREKWQQNEQVESALYYCITASIALAVVLAQSISTLLYYCLAA